MKIVAKLLSAAAGHGDQQGSRAVNTPRNNREDLLLQVA
jgi:hypothetical protein